MSGISLESAIRTCKVDTGWASRVRSDRFLNSNNLVCPIWNGVDTSGRPVCPDSFMTKRAGCNSAEDRVLVENNVSRPQYMEYINLNANGIQGDVYQNNMNWLNSGLRTRVVDNAHQLTGQFGNVSTDFGGAIYATCGVNAYKRAMAQNAKEDRLASVGNQSYGNFRKRQASGF